MTMCGCFRMTQLRRWRRILGPTRDTAGLRPALPGSATTWPGLKTVGKVTAARYQDGQTSTKKRYCLVSQACAPERLYELGRSHWGIENEMHWRLDVVFNEDQARNRKSLPSRRRGTTARTIWLCYASWR